MQLRMLAASLDLRVDDRRRRHGPVDGARGRGLVGQRRHAPLAAQAPVDGRADR